MDFDRTNSNFHQIIMAEEWDFDKTDIAELYLNDEIQEQEQDFSHWQNVNGLTIVYVPGYGRVQLVWIEEEND